MTQFNPSQVQGLEKAYKDIENLTKNTHGIKIATWVTAISTFLLAVAGIITLIIQQLK
jgi:hypothetical protein